MKRQVAYVDVRDVVTGVQHMNRTSWLSVTMDAQLSHYLEERSKGYCCALA